MAFCTLPAITVMPVMRVRPIISAEAVAAVRRGLRTEFCRASLPGDAEHPQHGGRRRDQRAGQQRA